MAVNIFPAPSAGNPTYAFTFLGSKLFQPNVPAGVYEVKADLPAGGLVSSVASGQDIFAGTPVARATGDGAASGLVNLTGSNSLMIQDTTPSRFDGAQFGERTLPTSLGEVSYVNGNYVTMSGGTSIYTSLDGLTWTQRETGAAAGLQSIAYGNGKYVATGVNGAVSTSTNLITWTNSPNYIPAGQTQNLYKVKFGNGFFVVIHSYSTIAGPKAAYSTDGVSWTPTFYNYSSNPYDVIYAQGMWVIVGGATQSLMTSPDLSTWTYRGLTTGEFYSLTFAQGQIWALHNSAAGAQSSTDGITWTSRTGISTNSTAIAKLVYANGEFVAAFLRQLSVTTNWVTWGVRYQSPSGQNNSGIATDGTKLVVSHVGQITRTSVNNFTGLNAGGAQIRASVFGPNQFVLGGGGGALVTSTNGAVWTSRTSGFGTTAIHGIAFGNGLYVAVGDGGTLRTSPDAITWTARTSQFGANAIYAVSFANGLFVAGGGSGGVATSLNGIDWTARTFGTTSIIYAIAGNSRVYIAGGQSGALRSSTDGITWTARTTTFGTTEIKAATFGNGLFVIGGVNGTLATSPDGVTWTARNSGFPTGATIWGLTFANGIFIAAGLSAIATSTDGITWVYDERPRSIIGAGNLNTVAAGAGRYVVGGDSGLAAIAEISADFGGARSVVLEYKGAAVAS